MVLIVRVKGIRVEREYACKSLQVSFKKEYTLKGLFSLKNPLC